MNKNINQDQNSSFRGRSQEQFELVNPYAKKVRQHPGMLFDGFDLEADILEISKRIENAGGVAMEIGSGSGEHLIALAKSQPETLFLGFEWRFKRAVRTIEKAKTEGLSNIIVFRADAGSVWTRCLMPESLKAMYINFPDPWAKRRQRKHRIVSHKLLQELCRYLCPDGKFIFRTDHREYFEWAISHLDNYIADARFSYEIITRDLLNSRYAPDFFPTEFQRLFLGQGLPVHLLKVSR